LDAGRRWDGALRRTKAPPLRGGASGSILIAKRGHERGRWGRMLRLGDLPSLDATGADANALGSAVDKGLYRLQVDVPAAPRNVVRVRDVVSKTRALAANVAYLCHDYSPNYGVSCRPEEATRRGRYSDVPEPGRSTGSASGARNYTRLPQLAEPLVYPEPGCEPRATLVPPNTP
jgi:hypothetical protein